MMTECVFRPCSVHAGPGQIPRTSSGDPGAKDRGRAGISTRCSGRSVPSKRPTEHEQKRFAGYSAPCASNKPTSAAEWSTLDTCSIDHVSPSCEESNMSNWSDGSGSLFDWLAVEVSYRAHNRAVIM